MHETRLFLEDKLEFLLKFLDFLPGKRTPKSSLSRNLLFGRVPRFEYIRRNHSFKVH